MKSYPASTLFLFLALAGVACGGAEQSSSSSPVPSDVIASTYNAPSAGTLAMADLVVAEELVEGPGSPAEAQDRTPDVGEAAIVEPVPSAPVDAAPDLDPAEESATVYSGVFTAGQAHRGHAVQQRECAVCHSAADWGQGRILGSFAGASAFDLLDHIRMTMPMDGPGRLSLEEYTDIVAYLLQLNGVPAGGEELPADEVRLRGIQIEYRR